ncbi:MAG TPA: hydrogenase maturation protease [Anaeromyxobacteraceae bacterium]|nr:hydrogenase maturation protease [Anaeromyxobacteraceae bacterium]
MSSPILVLCLGNRLRRDDGVAWRVADLLERDPPAGAAVVRTSLSGLKLLDEMEGFERVVLVDAIQSGRRAPGTVLSFDAEELPRAPGPTPHVLGLSSSLTLARSLGAPVPGRVDVVAVEIADASTFEEGLTPEVEAALPAAARAVFEALARLAAEEASARAATRSG